MSDQPTVEYVQARQTCTRCGHTSVECDRCDRTDLLLGGTVGVAYYCHTLSPARPTCFELTVRELADADAFWRPA